MKYTFFIFTTLLIFNCFSQKTETDTITITQPKTTNKGIAKSWESMKAFQYKWIKVEKDEKGYLIYDPCEGNPPTISIEDGRIIIDYNVEEPLSYSIEKITRLKGNKAVFISCFREADNKQIDIECKIFDTKNGLVCWEFEGHKWYMTPYENSNSFRQIINNCPLNKKKELTFIKIK